MNYKESKEWLGSLIEDSDPHIFLQWIRDGIFYGLQKQRPDILINTFGLTPKLAKILQKAAYFSSKVKLSRTTNSSSVSYSNGFHNELNYEPPKKFLLLEEKVGQKKIKMEESPSPPVSPYTGQIVRPKEKIKKKMPQERIPRKPYKCFKEMSEEFKHSLRKYYRQNGHNRQATSKKFDLSVGTINKILGPHLVEKRGRGRPRKDQAQRTPSTSPSPPNPDAGINPEIKAAAIAKFEETGSYYAAAKAVSHFKISDIINWVKNKNEK